MPETEDLNPQNPALVPPVAQNPVHTPHLLRPIHIALIFITGILIGVGGLLGYLEFTSTVSPQTKTPAPTCRPRPPCLDQTPRCLIPETEDMCPPDIVPTSSATYTCPANGWVDCMPGPGPVKKECTSAAMDWYKTNCPNFHGAAY